MTIRLLTPYSKYPGNAIVTLDAATEAGLIAAKQASSDTTGGVLWVEPAVPNQRYSAQIEVAPSGALVGVVGVNGKVTPIPAIGNTLGVIGDSRDDQAFNTVVNGLSTQTNANSYRSLKWALEIGGQCFRVVADSSLAGSGMGIVSSTANVRPTFPEQMASVLAAAPAYCWIRVPINDIFGGATAAQVWTPFKQVVDTVLSAGIRVELIASTLLDSTKGGYSTAVQAEIIKLNDLVRAEYGSKGGLGVMFHDTATVAMQQGVTTYAGISGAYADHVHFLNVGAYLEGSMIGLNWLSRFKPLPLLGTYAGDARRGVPANASSYGTALGTGSANYLSNGMFDLGTPVSGVAQGWAVISNTNCTYSASIVAAPTWNGNTDGKGQRIDVTFTGANAFLKLEGPNMFADVQLMKRYIAAALITVLSGASNIRNVRMELQVSSVATYNAIHGVLNTGDDTIPAMNTNGYQGVALCDLDLSLRPDIAASGGGDYFRLSFVISGGSATSGSASVIFSRAACRLVN